MRVNIFYLCYVYFHVHPRCFFKIKLELELVKGPKRHYWVTKSSNIIKKNVKKIRVQFNEESLTTQQGAIG